MPVTTSLPLPSVAPTKSAKAVSQPDTPPRSQQFAALWAALLRFEEHPAELAEQEQLRKEVRQVAASLAAKPPSLAEGPATIELLELAGRIATSGAHELVLETEDAVRSNEWLADGRAKIFAAMLQAPAYRLSRVLPVEDMPKWTWGGYARWLFTAPSVPLTPSDAVDFAAHLLRHTRDLAQLVSRNPGASSIRAAAEVFVTSNAALPLSHCDSDLRELLQLNAQLWSRARGFNIGKFTNQILPRAGRRLRVGFLANDFDPSSETYTAISAFEHLDRERFEVQLLSLSPFESPLAKYCEKRAQQAYHLSGDIRQHLTNIRGLQLDAIVLVGDLVANRGALYDAAIERLAPLQTVLHRHARTTGLSEVDLLIVGEKRSRPAYSSERVGLLRGLSRAFCFQITPPEKSAATHSTTTTFCSIVPAEGLSATTSEAWARILAAQPEAQILVQLIAGPARKLARAALRRTFAGYGIDPARLHVSECDSTDEAGLRERLVKGDIYLDPVTKGDARWAVEALALGMPVVACGGETAELLASAGLESTVAADFAAYEKIALTLAQSPAERSIVADRIRAAIEAGADFLDTLASADAFGHLLETAFDELQALGSVDFRRETAPLVAGGMGDATDAVVAGLAALSQNDLSTAAAEAELALRTAPGDPRVRLLHGKVLLQEGKPARAAEYLLPAASKLGSDTAAWLDVVNALHLDNKLADAVRALQIVLQLDPQLVEAWVKLADLADIIGAADLGQEALETVRKLDPGHPRLAGVATIAS